MAQFPLPFIGNDVSRHMNAGTGNNFLDTARRIVVGSMTEELERYSREGATDTVADVIARALTEQLNAIGILTDNNVTATYY